MTSSRKDKETNFVYGVKTPDSGTSIDGLSLKTRLGTRVDWVLQEMVTSGAHTAVGVQSSNSAGHLQAGEGVTPHSANQPWMLDYRCDGTAYRDTGFDLRFLIKHTMS